MKLRNKKTGEIIDTLNEYDCSKGISFGADHHDGNPTIKSYNSLAELNEEWEDAPEEPKGSALNLMILTLTNFIENEPDEDKVDLEDCKQMLEKLKAWERLKDKGFEFTGWDRHPDFPGDFRITASDEYTCADKDLDLLFGGEE